MYITIPVYWAEDEWEKKEDLGMEIENTLGEIHINTAHIVAHHETDDKMTMIRLTNGECFRSPITPDSFKEMINEVDIAIELKVNDN